MQLTCLNVFFIFSFQRDVFYTIMNKLIFQETFPRNLIAKFLIILFLYFYLNFLLFLPTALTRN